MVGSGLSMTSSSVHPKSVVAAIFQFLTSPSASIAMMARGEASMSTRRRSLVPRSASCVRRCSSNNRAFSRAIAA
jgi:multisubunit Na+/H+ antiporter MnhG subunit